MAQSQNGYGANDRDDIKTYTVPGTDVRVPLRKGDAGYLLVHLAAAFHRAVEPIDRGQLDDWGYAPRPIRGQSTVLSNHASGTAIDINATQHPRLKWYTFSPIKRRKIRALLAQYDGVIRWGGDYKRIPDDMHFEIVGSADQVKRVADRLQKVSAVGTKPRPGRYETRLRETPRYAKRNHKTPFRHDPAGKPLEIVAIERGPDGRWRGRPKRGAWRVMDHLKSLEK